MLSPLIYYGRHNTRNRKNSVELKCCDNYISKNKCQYKRKLRENATKELNTDVHMIEFCSNNFVNIS